MEGNTVVHWSSVDEFGAEEPIVAQSSDGINLGLRLRTPILNAISQDSINGSLLEIGCGNGALANSLAPLFKRVVAIDRQFDVRHHSKTVQSGSSVSYISADFESYKFKEHNRFNVIVCAFSAHHFDLSRSLTKIRSLLRARGEVIIVDLFAEHRENLAAYLFDQICLSHLAKWSLSVDRRIPTVKAQTLGYLGDRIRFFAKNGGMDHVIDDLRHDRPPSFSEWTEAFARHLPNGNMAIITASTFIYKWKAPVTTDMCLLR